MSKILGITADDKFTLAGTFLKIPIQNIHILMNALRGIELLPDEKDKASQVLSDTLMHIPPPLQNLARTELEECLGVKHDAKKAFDTASHETKERDKIASSRSKDPTQKQGWIYYPDQDVMGYREFTITKQCPNRGLIANIIQDPDKDLSPEESDKLVTALTWLRNNTFKGQPKEVMAKVFKIFPEHLVEESDQKAIKVLSSRSVSGGGFGKTAITPRDTGYTPRKD